MISTILNWGKTRLNVRPEKKVWCLGCRTRRPSRIELTLDNPSGGKRMIGQCRHCNARTSTFVSA
jgi:hypothetical protein